MGGKMIGYVCPNIDDDGDGLINGFKLLHRRQSARRRQRMQRHL